MTVKLPINTILAIDTSCDETAVAITNQRRILSNILASQVEIHRKYGGVFPTEAKRAHQEKINHVVEEAMKRAREIDFDFIDAVAVTYGPGLAPALEVGIRKAKELAKEFNKPLIAVNHLEGHLLSTLAQNSKGEPAILHSSSLPAQAGSPKARATSQEEIKFPILSLLVSGGHTELVVTHDLLKGKYEVIGRTRDDAAGEAYDKVARMLKLGYPGGEIIEKLAKKGDADKFNFPIPMAQDQSLDFSFSGLKTSVMYTIKGLLNGNALHHVPMKTIQSGDSPVLDRQTICDLAASFQRVIIKSLLIKINKAIQLIKPKSIWLGGGVGANLKLRQELRNAIKPYDLRLYTPYSQRLYTDNAAMIGIAAWFKAQREEFVEDIESLDRLPGLDL